MTPIQQIKAALPVNAYASRYLTIKAGKALCPFHKEKTPSLSLKAEYFKCHGCGESGDVISFASQYHGISTAAAIRMLADEFGIPLTKQLSVKPYDAVKAKRERMEADEWRRQGLSAIRTAMLADDYDRILPFLTAFEASNHLSAYRAQRTIEQAALLRASVRESDLWVKAMTPMIERLLSL